MELARSQSHCLYVCCLLGRLHVRVCGSAAGEERPAKEARLETMEALEHEAALLLASV